MPQGWPSVEVEFKKSVGYCHDLAVTLAASRTTNRGCITANYNYSTNLYARISLTGDHGAFHEQPEPSRPFDENTNWARTGYHDAANGADSCLFVKN